MDNFQRELQTLLLASYPFVWLQTFEELRTLEIVGHVARLSDKLLKIVRPDSDIDLSDDDDEDDGGAYVDWAIRCAAEARNEVIAIVDAHPWLHEPARIRALRELVEVLAKNGTCVIFVSPTVVTPPELVKDWTVLRVPPPDRAQLQEILARVLPADAWPGVSHERLSIAALGLTEREAERAWERARHLRSGNPDPAAPFDWEGVVVHEKRRLMNTSGALEFVDLSINLDSVGGLDDLKSWVAQRRRAFSDEARAFGLPQPKGLLMVGIQGCGKSLAAKAVAGFWGLPLLRLDLGALFSGAIPPDDALRGALATSEAMAPSVLWVDELEKAFEEQDAGTTRLLGSLLTWLQEKTSPVFFVATANRVDRLPPELLRRGRFDELFFIDLPDIEAREAILAIHLRKRNRKPEAYDLNELARLCEHFSGAELEQVIVSGLYTAFSDNRDLSQRDLTVACRQLVPLYQMYETETKSLRSWAHGRARPAARDRKLTNLFK